MEVSGNATIPCGSLFVFGGAWPRCHLLAPPQSPEPRDPYQGLPFFRTLAQNWVAL